jgi:hypothetical protein
MDELIENYFTIININVLLLTTISNIRSKYSICKLSAMLDIPTSATYKPNCTLHAIKLIHNLLHRFLRWTLRWTLCWLLRWFLCRFLCRFLRRFIKLRHTTGNNRIKVGNYQPTINRRLHASIPNPSSSSGSRAACIHFLAHIR